MICKSPMEITQYFIRTHMEKRNLEDALSCLTDTIMWFGTGEFETVHGKEEAKRNLIEEITAFPVGYTIDFKNMSETMLTRDCGTVFGQMSVTDHAMKSRLECRVTTNCVKVNGSFLIDSLHMSLPTELQTGKEYYPFTIAEEKINEIRNDFFNATLPGGLLCCEVDKGFKMRYVNDFFVKLLGYNNKEEFFSATKGLFANCFNEAEDVIYVERNVKAMKINEHSTFTYRVKTKSGGKIWLRAHKQKYQGDGTQGLLCFCMDISDIIQMENELKAQKNKLEFANAEIQTIISNVPGGVHRCPLFERIHVDYVSHGFEEMCGYTKAEIHNLFNDNYSLLLIEEDRKVFAEAMRTLAKKPAKKILEYRILKKDGTIIRVTDHFRSVRMEDGKMWGFGVATDVTTQHETLAQIKLLTDSIPGGLGVYQYSPKGLETVYFSDGVCEMLGYTREEYAKFTKTHLKDMVFDEDYEPLRKKIKQLAAGKSSIDCIYRVRTKSGGYSWLNLRGTAVERRDDTVRVNAVLLDITEAKEAEEKLRIRDEEYSLAIRQSGKTVYRYNIADKSIHILQKNVDVFDFPFFAEDVPNSIIKKGIIATENIDDFINFYAAIDKGEKSGSVTLRRKMLKGDFGWCNANFITLFNDIGKPVSAVISIEDITKQHQQELENEVLRQNEQLFQIVVSHSDRFIVKYDTKTCTAYLQPNTAKAFYVDEIVHNVPYNAVESDGFAEESIKTYINFYEKLIAGEPTVKANIKLKKHKYSEEWGWYQFDGSVVFDDKNQPNYAVVSFMEVTEQYEKELAYERMSKHITQLSKDAMLYFEANLTEMKIEHASGYWLNNIEANLKANPVELLGKSINKIIYPDDRESIREFFDRKNLFNGFIHGKTEKEAEYRIIHNNKPKWISITVEMVADPYTENILIYVLFRDIDKTKTKEINILKQAQTDGLTNLYNRAAIEEKIKDTLKNKTSQMYGLAIIDVDNLKEVNDTLGHIQGDHAIIAFADILGNYFGDDDIVGRIGGDEFIVFLKNYQNKKEIQATMDILIKKLSSLHTGENNNYHLHGSIGIALRNSLDDSFESLYKKADTALYFVKRHGKNNYEFYSDYMETENNLIK
ncbi:MAG: GGDEF domain-containing protein [Clostridiales bacterium]